MKANMIEWVIGDIVIHRADAKKKEMLMMVVGRADDGDYITKYVTPNEMNGDANRKTPEFWRNPKSALLNPQKFNLD